MALENQNPILGYVVCKDCMTPKAISKQNGKRSKFFLGRCKCGTDNRTQAIPQQIMSQYKPLEEVQAEIERLKAAMVKNDTPVVKNEPKEPDSLPKPQPDGQKPQQNEPTPQQSEPDAPKSDNGTMKSFACAGIGALFGVLIGKGINAVRAMA
ncbi:hypothetical protein [Vibrio nigripulchritudo]|uniref:hypothetical protein n=1 Tax=Vibrio nigripulchritudo TaxID=28173 RepID=UPI002490F521|nr:hypothetical protein [Vibrio nigripulchritudo]BDU46892.1 hypothetical protein TUMSATVNIG3_56900 [Vibrio nigripulchritudo]